MALAASTTRSRAGAAVSRESTRRRATWNTSSIAALKADAGTSALRAIGFASHVHTELIAAARNAGADEVLPRSAFAGRLADILQAGAAKPAP